MTNTALKAQIDSEITNETTPAGITPTDVGTNLKSVVDYVDQEIKTKVIKTIISEAQILSLFDSPITVLDSSDAGKVKFPISIYIKRNAGTAYTLATTSFAVINDLGTSLSANINPNPMANTSDGFFQSYINVNQNFSGVDKNSLYKLRANTGNPTGGTGALDVYVTYIEITQ